MRLNWDLKPNLLECILEDRIVPAPLNNLGMIVQTTGGLALVTPFPGAVNMSSVSGSTQSSSTAASVSGTAMPTSLYMTARGLSQFTPGNMTGNSAIAGTAAAASGGGSGMTIKVGSGADEDGGPVSAPAMSRTNPGYGGTTNPVMAYIGQVSSTSGSSTTSTSQGTPTQSAPVPSLPPPGIVIPGSPTGTSSGSSPMSPQFGAPRLLRGLGNSLTPSLPGGLGVGSLTSPAGSGGY